MDVADFVSLLIFVARQNESFGLVSLTCTQ